jgi:hypothetical protein
MLRCVDWYMFSDRVFRVQQCRKTKKYFFFQLFIPRMKALRLRTFGTCLPVDTVYESTTPLWDLATFGLYTGWQFSTAKTTLHHAIRNYSSTSQTPAGRWFHNTTIFFPSSLRECSCGASLCFSHSVLYSGGSWICISGWASCLKSHSFRQ